MVEQVDHLIRYGVHVQLLHDFEAVLVLVAADEDGDLACFEEAVDILAYHHLALCLSLIFIQCIVLVHWILQMHAGHLFSRAELLGGDDDVAEEDLLAELS